MNYLRTMRLLPVAVFLACVATPAQAQLTSQFDKVRVWLRSAEPVASALYDLNGTMVKADVQFGQYMSGEITRDSVIWSLDSLEQEAKMIVDLTRESAAFLAEPPEVKTTDSALRLPDVYADINGTLDAIAAVNFGLFTAYKAGIGGDMAALDLIGPLTLDQKDLLFEISKASMYSEILMYSNRPHPQAELLKLMQNSYEATLVVRRLRLALFQFTDPVDAAIRLERLEELVSEMETNLTTAITYQTDWIADLEADKNRQSYMLIDQSEKTLASFKSYDEAWPVEQQIIDQCILIRDGIASGSLEDIQMTKALEKIIDLRIESTKLMGERQVFYIP